MTVQKQYILDCKISNASPRPILITPEMASEMLAKNTNNYRSIKKSVVDVIANSIILGQWKINGATIRFSEEGRLMDGQHRLHAIVKAGIAVPCFVVYGLPEESDITIDIDGELRKLEDHLIKKEECNAKVLSTVIRNLAKYDTGNFFDKTTRISSTSSVSILDRFPGIRDAVNKFARKNLITRPSILAMCYFIIKMKHQDNVEIVDEFFDKLVNGDSLEENSPLLILRNVFIASKIKGNMGLDRKFSASIIIKTWNYYQNTNPKKRRFTKNSLIKDSIIPVPL